MKFIFIFYGICICIVCITATIIVISEKKLDKIVKQADERLNELLKEKQYQTINSQEHADSITEDIFTRIIQYINDSISRRSANNFILNKGVEYKYTIYNKLIKSAKCKARLAEREYIIY